MTVLVTGGVGYIGIGTCAQLLESGRTVRVLDSLLHGQRDLADQLAASGVEVQIGDIRDPVARAKALAGVDEVVHLAAIVGDPACARDPRHSNSVNVEGATAMVRDAAAAGVQRFVFASTCSNYGRMADPTVPITEEGELRPVSLYAEQKVGIEELLLAGGHGMVATCLRFATIYGVAPRMRFDLTVNEFTRDLWAGRHLEVFGEQFWRPYVHVRDAGRAVRAVLDHPADVVGGQVFNVGNSAENYRKLDIVEAVTKAVPNASVSFVARDEDPRDYKVSFDKIARVLGFTTTATVPDGIAEVIEALEAGRFADPFSPIHRN
ncbi:Nucleoside-diphosphate-sugar epimerase [Pseudonocardia thermophila]|jgi:Nucleoside-diphosphate-sugar epimerases|uniref:Nucleoside-diphosphate-sugar epimerase n=1 Tax=Pseudonocardia thermophila TaxID=1848 RepID=A0A1M7A911_PSETH|nr:NAD(P)-dependent oxidoreductase [Pseudonocardia thermophila]SHL39118.1 Nucleoside-diphosphate-sugar epimerase [Pseudonocardia thermophila]